MSTSRIVEKIKHYPIIFLGAVLSLVLVGLIYLDELSLPELKAEHQRLNQEKKVMDYNAINAVRFSENLENLKSITENINSRLMDPSERASIYQYLFQLEEEAGVTIKNPRQIQVIPIEGKKKTPGKQPMVAVTKYKMDLDGNFSQILKFIYKIQTGYYFSRIDAFELKPSKDLEPNVLTLSLSLNFFGKSD